jgi:hypothetical protein
MTSRNEANRQNAQKSTGPRTENGKRRSRLNALRHGLAAETVVEALENPRTYKKFQAAIVSHYAPQSPLEHELVLRLASLLWRLRRATSIETGLFEIQAASLGDSTSTSRTPIKPSIDLYQLLALRNPSAQIGPIAEFRPSDETTTRPSLTNGSSGPSASRRVAQCYTRLVNLDKALFERVGYYEARLWRQFANTLVLLDLIQRASPLTGRSFFRTWNRPPITRRNFHKSDLSD